MVISLTLPAPHHPGRVGEQTLFHPGKVHFLGIVGRGDGLGIDVAHHDVLDEGQLVAHRQGIGLDIAVRREDSRRSR